MIMPKWAIALAITVAVIGPGLWQVATDDSVDSNADEPLIHVRN